MLCFSFHFFSFIVISFFRFFTSEFMSPLNMTCFKLVNYRLSSFLEKKKKTNKNKYKRFLHFNTNIKCTLQSITINYTLLNIDLSAHKYSYLWFLNHMYSICEIEIFGSQVCICDRFSVTNTLHLWPRNHKYSSIIYVYLSTRQGHILCLWACETHKDPTILSKKS